jgi:hypothetical protein
MFWRMKKKEISKWLEIKEWDFSQQENMNPWMSDKQWMQRYVFTYLHEIFFGEFLNILTEWLERLVEKTVRCIITTPMNWTPELVKQLNYLSNPTSQAVDFWLDNILGGYVTKYAVYCIQSYSVADRDLFKIPCRRFLKSLGTWINMLLCEKNMMIMESDY